MEIFKLVCLCIAFYCCFTSMLLSIDMLVENRRRRNRNKGWKNLSTDIAIMCKEARERFMEDCKDIHEKEESNEVRNTTSAKNLSVVSELHDKQSRD